MLREEPAVADAVADVAGEKAAFVRFYEANVGAVTGLAYALTGNWSVAEDLAQEAFVRAYRDWARVGHLGRADAWVRTVTANLATSRWRRLLRETRALVRLPTNVADGSFESATAEADSFWRAVRTLPRRQAQATALRYFDDLSVAEVAAAMGCAEGTAKAHLHAARKALAARLTASVEGSDV